MTRTIVFSALASCVAAVVAAAAVLVSGSDRPSARFADSFDAVASLPALAANREGKADKLFAPGLIRPAPQAAVASPDASDPMRQAFASDSPLAPQPPNLAAPATIAPSAVPPKPKLAAKPPPPVTPQQKSYALLSDQQIAAIKVRLQLTPDQEYYWPGVEAALRAIARKLHATRQNGPSAGPPPIDPDSDEVSQLKSAAMPLLFQLREDQKREVRSLARLIGLEAVAARI